MKIAWTSIYGEMYENDRCFNPENCTIGENLLLPGIALKQYMEKEGHEYHTIDQYNLRDIDAVIFSDIPKSLLTMGSWKDLIRYMIHRKWRKDWLLKMVCRLPKEKRILVIMEPPAVSPKSYQKKYHALFGKILTWDDDLLADEKYYKIFYPQPFPQRRYDVPFQDKRMLAMICGNKTSDFQNELYSERRKVIEFFEDRELEFDLYGFGWEKEEYKNYKGSTNQKLKVLSKYKYCICYENNCKIKGYITEKIFDCFFAGCVPVYWGADNVEDYIPEGCFIDRRKFRSIEDIYNFISRIPAEEYESYLCSMNNFLSSMAFTEHFSVNAYIKKMTEAVLGR